MPGLFIELMDALKKSNSNVLDLKETIDELIKKEKKNLTKIKEVEKENENFRNILDKKTLAESE